jgi:hypothetical protein
LLREKPDVLAVFLGPGCSGMPGSSNVDLITFTGDAVNTSCFQSNVILDEPKETGDLPRWKPYSFDIISG